LRGRNPTSHTVANAADCGEAAVAGLEDDDRDHEREGEIEIENVRHCLRCCLSGGERFLATGAQTPAGLLLRSSRKAQPHETARLA